MTKLPMFTRMALIIMSATLSMTALAANAAEMDHGKMGHGAMNHGKMKHDMGPAVTTGPWSYKDRDTPDPYTKKRWEMVPVPGYGHMYISGGGLSSDLRCAAIMDNPRFMVDRKTQAECGKVSLPATPGRPPAHTDHRH